MNAFPNPAENTDDFPAKKSGAPHNSKRTFDEVEIALQIPSDAEFVRVVRLTVLGVASRMPFSFDDIEDIKLAVSEACNNAILHARVSPQNMETALSADAHGVQQTFLQPPIVVRLLPLRDRLEITVEDGGRIASPGFFTRRARKPVVSPDEIELPEGGMGLFLIQSLMDEVQHLSGDNDNTVIHMTKMLPQFRKLDARAETMSNATPFAPPTSPVSSASVSSASVSPASVTEHFSAS